MSIWAPGRHRVTRGRSDHRSPTLALGLGAGVEAITRVHELGLLAQA